MWIIKLGNSPDFHIALHLPSGFSSIRRYLKKRKGSHPACVGLSSSLAKRVKPSWNRGGPKGSCLIIRSLSGQEILECIAEAETGGQLCAS